MTATPEVTMSLDDKTTQSISYSHHSYGNCCRENPDLATLTGARIIVLLTSSISYSETFSASTPLSRGRGERGDASHVKTLQARIPLSGGRRERGDTSHVKTLQARTLLSCGRGERGDASHVKMLQACTPLSRGYGERSDARLVKHFQYALRSSGVARNRVSSTRLCSEVEP